MAIGVSSLDIQEGFFVGGVQDSICFASDGQAYNSGEPIDYSDPWQEGDSIGLLIDNEACTVRFMHNGKDKGIAASMPFLGYTINVVISTSY